MTNHQASRWLAACVLGLALLTPAWADSLDTLDAFVRTASSGRAEFTQVVTQPAREGQTARSKTSSGSFEFLRPNRFRFHYKKPFEQLIVADGQTLWLYDPDLRQATARKLKDVLNGTPAAVISSAQDLSALRADFLLQAAPDKDGLQWITATPKARDGQLQSVRVGFNGRELAALEIQDNFGQHSLISFSKVELNPSLGADAFQFKPPAGVDVVRP
jgi:outer membrane lipoprotein carrier protein